MLDASMHNYVYKLFLFIGLSQPSVGSFHREKVDTFIDCSVFDVATIESCRDEMKSIGNTNDNAMIIAAEWSQVGHLFKGYEIWIYSIVGSILVGISGILPLIVIPIKRGPPQNYGPQADHLKLMLSFAVGSLLGDVFCHLLPEVWLYMDRSDDGADRCLGLCVIGGLIFFFIVEKFVGDEKESVVVTGYLNLLANVVDNFLHGLAVGSSFLVSYRVGLLTTGTILIHEIPHEFGDFAILLRSGFDIWKAAKAQLLTASGCVIGAVTALITEQMGERTAWILAFTSGGFLYISLVTVIPDLLQEKRARESLKQTFFIVLGILCMVFFTCLSG